MFRTPLIVIAGWVATCALLSAPATAQIVTFGGDGERKTSSIYFWNKAENKLAGGLEFSYGSPVWKDAHEEATGSMRLGKDGWASLDTSVALTIGGVKVPAGNWYLGLRRDEDKYFLMVMKAETLRKQMVPPWGTAKVRAKINAPLEKSKLDQPQTNLLISVAPGKKEPTKGTFTLSWGPHKLSTSLVAHLGEKQEPTPKKVGKGQK